MAEREQINIRVSPSTKRAWEEYVADSFAHNSITGLIRVAIANEIDGSKSSQDSADHTDDLAEILESVRRVENDLTDLGTRVRSIERKVERRPDIMKLATEVFDRLPTTKPGTEEWQAKVARYSPDQSTVWPGTVEAIAAALDSDERDIRDALERLQSDTYNVQNVTVAGENRWWRS